jgi:hypothetical protein
MAHRRKNQRDLGESDPVAQKNKRLLFMLTQVKVDLNSIRFVITGRKIDITGVKIDITGKKFTKILYKKEKEGRE